MLHDCWVVAPTGGHMLQSALAHQAQHRHVGMAKVRGGIEDYVEDGLQI